MLMPKMNIFLPTSDEETAYKPADQVVLARLPKDKLIDWRYYEFFAGYNNKGLPVWEDIRKRKPSFTNPDKCYRTGMSYSKELKRFLWCHIIPLSGKEEAQGLGFVEALA